MVGTPAYMSPEQAQLHHLDEVGRIHGAREHGVRLAPRGGRS